MKMFWVVVLVATVSWTCHATQPNAIGNVRAKKIAIEARTLAQVDALTPDTTGQIVFCSDCDFKLCVSTGADSGNVGAFVVVGSTVLAATSGPGVPVHCQ